MIKKPYFALMWLGLIRYADLFLDHRLVFQVNRPKMWELSGLDNAGTTLFLNRVIFDHCVQSIFSNYRSWTIISSSWLCLRSECDLLFLDRSIVDMEDLKKKRRLRPSSLPLVVELNVFNNEQFASLEEIDTQLQKIKLSFPKGIEVRTQSCVLVLVIHYVLTIQS